MGSLAERDAAALLEMVAELDHLDDPLPFPPQFLGRLAKLIGTNDASYCALDRRHERRVQEIYWCDGDELVDGPSDEAGNPYWRLRHSHPVCSYRERTGDWTTARTVSQFAAQDAFRRTAVWDEVYREEGINYWLDIGLPPQEGVTRVFIFVHGTRDFGDRELLLLQLLGPHLERRAQDVEMRAAAVDALAAVEDGGDEPHDLVLATARGTIEFASPQSREILRRYLGITNGALPEAILEGTAVVPDGGGRLTIRTARAGELVVLLLAEEDARTERLTPRQREVLAGVAAGLTDAEIAERLGVARATVGKHLEAIYERLEVHNRTSAAALLHG
ncbi:MAG TPA: helix-turn-helix transcriptional regulator [Gaiellaceae bacterium]|nr:helix-turn-helix transcriptional regulator [Gaiellaceae bacterium]